MCPTIDIIERIRHFEKLRKNKKWGGGKIGIAGDAKFVLLRYAKFYSIYLPACVWFFMLHLFSGYQLHHDIGMIKTACSDFAISLTMVFGNVGGWFVRAILVYYLLFPILYRCTKKYGALILALCSVPSVLSFVFGVFEGEVSLWCYLLPFALGIYFEQKGILDKVKENSKNVNICIPILCLFVTFVLRLIFALSMDIFFALAIMFFEMTVLAKSKLAEKVLDFFGKHSANLWLIHKPWYVKPWHVLWTGRISIKYLIVLLISIVISLGIEKVKKITPYNKMFSAIYKRIQK